VAGLIRVRSLAATRRRAGLAFTRDPLVIGPESLGVGIAALISLAAIVSDPALVVEVSGEETPDVFTEIGHNDRQAIADLAISAELSADDELSRAAIEHIVEGLIGKMELQSPEEAEDKGDGAAASSPAPDAKAEAGVDAAPAAETPPASDASAADGEQSRAGVDASVAAPAAGADAGKQPEDTQQPPVADGTTLAAIPAAEAANPAAAAPAAPAAPDPKKGNAVPVEAKAKAVAKPRGSSGRKAPASASTGGAKA